MPTEPDTTTAHEPEGRGRYALVGLHATGGIGRVWVARDAELGRDVALKELRPERLGHEAARARFLEEARVTGQLEHPGIVPVHELIDGDAAKRDAAVAAARERVATLQFEERWADAGLALEQAVEVFGEPVDEGDYGLWVSAERAHLALVSRLDEIRLERTRPGAGGEFDFATFDRRYEEAFTKHGFGPSHWAESDFALLVSASPLREPLLAALDDWAAVTRDRGREARLLRVARLADPHPWRDKLRDPALREGWPKRWRELAALAAEAPASAMTPSLAAALGARLQPSDEGAALLRAALVERPGDFWLHYTLGYSLAARGDARGAESHYRAALALRPGNPLARNNLAAQLFSQRRYAEAEPLMRAAYRLDPDQGFVRNNLAVALAQQSKLDEAEAHCRDVLGRAPADAFAKEFLLYLGNQREAEPKLAAYLAGKYKPTTDERLILAALCRRQRLHRAAYRLMADEIAAHPEMANTLRTGLRYLAACDAVLAAGGDAADAPAPSAQERARLRAQALAWLDADLQTWSKRIFEGEEGRDLALRTLGGWLHDERLADVRTHRITTMSDPENKDWSRLWLTLHLYRDTTEKMSRAGR